MFRRILIALPTVLLICGVGVAIALPGPQHMLCPSCHGLEKLAPNTFVEAGMPAAKRQRIRDQLGRARARVKAFYGTYYLTRGSLSAVRPSVPRFLHQRKVPRASRMVGTLSSFPNHAFLV